MRKNWLLLTLLFTGLAGISYADLKFFWLDRPTSRDNKFDPSSPNYVPPTPVGGGSTSTPVNGSPTSTPTATPINTVGATATPTQTVTPCASCHGALVADFEETDNSVDLWGGAISTSSSGNSGAFVGSYASSISPMPWISTSASTGGNPGNCGCVSGSIGQQASPWPWVSYQFNLGAVAGTDVSVASYATNHGIQFDFKATVANVPYRIRVKQQDVTDSGFYGYTFTPTDTLWHTLTVYFPGYGGGQPEFAQPSWAAVQPFGTVMNGIEFIAVGNATASSSFGFCVDNITFAVAAQPMDTPTPTTMPTAGVSWPIVYNGDTVPLGTNFYGAGGSVGCVEVTSAGAGNGGSNVYASMTMSSAVGGYSAAGVFATGFSASGAPLTYNATAYNSLSIALRVPSATGDCMIPAVSVLCYNPATGVTKTSGAVSAESYLSGGAQFMGADTWYTALIPLSAFEAGVDGTGFNGKPAPNSATLTATDFQSIDGVQVEPHNYGNTGAFTGAVYVDDVQFVATASTLMAGGRTTLFADFENGTADNWGGYWSANVDAFNGAGTDCTGLTTPPGTGTTCNTCYSAITYGGVTDTAGAAGSNTPCHDGHLAGWVGVENGQYPSSGNSTVTCPAGSVDFPYLNMTADLAPAGPAPGNLAYDVNLSDNSYVSSLSGGATGLKFKLKLGPNGDPGQVYKIFIDRDSNNSPAIGTAVANHGGTNDNGGYIYYVQIAASSLSASTWTSFTIPFPADGFCVGCAGVTASAPTAPVTTPQQPGATNNVHNDQGPNTELFFGQDQYNTSTTGWHRDDIYDVGVGPLLRAKMGDIYIDDVQFY